MAGIQIQQTGLSRLLVGKFPAQTRIIFAIFLTGNLGVKVNGHGHPEVDFLTLLEKEEADFAEQIKKQKSFLQGVFKDKEELAQLCVTQSNKLSKLENERTEWQRKIIEIEREKRDYLERLDGEQQAHR